MARERWKDVVDFCGGYQVSNLGRIRSVDRAVPHARYGVQNRKGKVLSSSLSSNGHLAVCLRRYRGGPRQGVQVHQLVAEVWIGPCPPGQQVRHGPAGHLDNSVGNLCYGTLSENKLDMRRDGTHGGKAVRRSDGKVFISMHVAAEESGCHATNIWAVCNRYDGRITTGGFGWEYAEDSEDSS